MRIAVLGAGHIGGACVNGFIKAGVKDIIVTARTAATLSRYPSDIEKSLDNAAAVNGSDVIIIAVKTGDVAAVASQIRELLVPGQIVACMAAQVSPEDLSDCLRNKDGVLPGIAYAIPNTAAEIGESMTFISDVSAGDAGVAILRNLFSLIGETAVVSRGMLAPGISLASCGMGYAIKYIDAAVKAGMAVGFTPEESAKAVLQTVKGSSLLLALHGESPENELRKVATPGGLTEKGVNAMDEAGFDEAVLNGVKASLK